MSWVLTAAGWQQQLDHQVKKKDSLDCGRNASVTSNYFDRGLNVSVTIDFPTLRGHENNGFSVGWGHGLRGMGERQVFKMAAVFQDS